MADGTGSDYCAACLRRIAVDYDRLAYHAENHGKVRGLMDRIPDLQNSLRPSGYKVQHHHCRCGACYRWGSVDLGVGHDSQGRSPDHFNYGDAAETDGA